jgi:multidrug efflux pump subunit AcrA (membrane-fusion protein)
MIRRHKARAIAVLVLALAGAGVGTYYATKSSSADYELTAATSGTVQQTVSATATIEAINQASVNFAVAGRVTSVPVSVGQTVTAGEVLATIDPSTLQATVAEDQAQVATDQAKLDDDESGESVASAATGAHHRPPNR